MGAAVQRGDAARVCAAAPLVRPVRPDDAALIDGFVQRLSPASRQRRFHAAIRALPAAWLERMTHPDAQRELALLATTMLDGVEHCVGEARYVVGADDAPEHQAAAESTVREFALVRADCGEREFALAVADGWQGCGLGRSMLRKLVRHAARHGVRRLYGDVLRDNLPMIELARSLDFELRRHPSEARLLRVERVLRAAPVPHAQAQVAGPAVARARIAFN